MGTPPKGFGFRVNGLILSLGFTWRSLVLQTDSIHAGSNPGIAMLGDSGPHNQVASRVHSRF